MGNNQSSKPKTNKNDSKKTNNKTETNTVQTVTQTVASLSMDPQQTINSTVKKAELGVKEVNVNIKQVTFEDLPDDPKILKELLKQIKQENEKKDAVIKEKDEINEKVTKEKEELKMVVEEKDVALEVLAPNQTVEQAFNHALFVTSESAPKSNRESSSNNSTNAKNYFPVKENLLVQEWKNNDFAEFLEVNANKIMVDDIHLLPKILNTMINRDIGDDLKVPYKMSSEKVVENVVESHLQRAFWSRFEAIFRYNVNKTMPEYSSNCTIDKLFDKEYVVRPTPGGYADCDFLVKLSMINKETDKNNKWCCIVEVKPDYLHPVGGKEKRRKLKDAKLLDGNLANFVNSDLYGDQTKDSEDPVNKNSVLGYQRCSVKQVVTYMIENRVKYGIITTMKKWNFLQYNEETFTLDIAGPFFGDYDVALSAGKIKWSIWHVFLRFLLCSGDYYLKKRRRVPGYVNYLADVIMKPYKPDSSDDEDDDVTTASGKKGKGTTSSSTAKSKSPKKTSSTTSSNTNTKSPKSTGKKTKSTINKINKQLNPFWYRKITCADLLEEDEDLGYQSGDAKFICTSRTGNVWQKDFGDGHNAIIKQLAYADDEEPEQRREEIRNEHRIYEHLASVQGLIIPRLFYAGVMMTNMSDCIATSYEGEPLDQDYVVITEELIQKCLAVVDRIHSFGVYHNDLELRNILLRAKDQTPIIIDFGNSKLVDINDSNVQKMMLQERDYIESRLRELVKPNEEIKGAVTRKRRKDNSISIS